MMRTESNMELQQQVQNQHLLPYGVPQQHQQQNMMPHQPTMQCAPAPPVDPVIQQVNALSNAMNNDTHWKQGFYDWKRTVDEQQQQINEWRRTVDEQQREINEWRRTVDEKQRKLEEYEENAKLWQREIGNRHEKAFRILDEAVQKLDEVTKREAELKMKIKMPSLRESMEKEREKQPSGSGSMNTPPAEKSDIQFFPGSANSDDMEISTTVPISGNKKNRSGCAVTTEKRLNAYTSDLMKSSTERTPQTQQPSPTPLPSNSRIYDMNLNYFNQSPYQLYHQPPQSYIQQPQYTKLSLVPLLKPPQAFDEQPMATNASLGPGINGQQEEYVTVREIYPQIVTNDELPADVQIEREFHYDSCFDDNDGDISRFQEQQQQQREMLMDLIEEAPAIQQHNAESFEENDAESSTESSAGSSGSEWKAEKKTKKKQQKQKQSRKKKKKTVAKPESIFVMDYQLTQAYKLPTNLDDVIAEFEAECRESLANEALYVALKQEKIVRTRDKVVEHELIKASIARAPPKVNLMTFNEQTITPGIYISESGKVFPISKLQFAVGGEFKRNTAQVNVAPALDSTCIFNDAIIKDVVAAVKATAGPADDVLILTDNAANIGSDIKDGSGPAQATQCLSHSLNGGLKDMLYGDTMIEYEGRKISSKNFINAIEEITNKSYGANLTTARTAATVGRSFELRNDLVELKRKKTCDKLLRDGEPFSKVFFNILTLSTMLVDKPMEKRSLCAAIKIYKDLDKCKILTKGGVDYEDNGRVLAIQQTLLHFIKLALLCCTDNATYPTLLVVTNVCCYCLKYDNEMKRATCQERIKRSLDLGKEGGNCQSTRLQYIKYELNFVARPSLNGLALFRIRPSTPQRNRIEDLSPYVDKYVESDTMSVPREAKSATEITWAKAVLGLMPELAKKMSGKVMSLYFDIDYMCTSLTGVRKGDLSERLRKKIIAFCTTYCTEKKCAEKSSLQQTADVDKNARKQEKRKLEREEAAKAGKGRKKKKN